MTQPSKSPKRVACSRGERGSEHTTSAGKTLTTPREWLIAVLRRLKHLIHLRASELVNVPGGIAYVGEEHIALVVPNGIIKILSRLRDAGSAPAGTQSMVLQAMHDFGGCVAFSFRRTICRARVLYPGRPRGQRVNVVLVLRDLIDPDNTASLFDGSVEFFDIKEDKRLPVAGFRTRRELRIAVRRKHEGASSPLGMNERGADKQV